MASAAQAMSRLVGRAVTETQAAAVRTPDGTADADELAEAAQLLGELEAAFLEESRKASVNAVRTTPSIQRRKNRGVGHLPNCGQFYWYWYQLERWPLVHYLTVPYFCVIRV